MTTITISEQKIERQGGVVILPMKEYRELCERAVPIYYLKGKGARKLDKRVIEALKEYRNGKCRTIKSLADLD